MTVLSKPTPDPSPPPAQNPPHQPPQPPAPPANKLDAKQVIVGGKTIVSSPRRRSLKPTVFWRLAENIPARLQWLLMILSVSLPLALWWHFSHLPSTNPVFLPKPETVWAALRDLWQHGLLQQDVQTHALTTS